MSLIAPNDVVIASDAVTEALRPAAEFDWTARAGRLDWTVDQTLAHLTGAPAKYALYLASRSTRFIAVTVDRWPDASRKERIDAIGDVARALANIATASPPDVRAYHSSGMLGAEGFVALGCLELLVHGHDVTEGLGLPFEPPEDLCRTLVSRLLPWLVDAGPAWQTILWHTGRIDVAGRPSSDASWRAVAVPLAEWDGTIPRRDPRPLIEWVRDEAPQHGALVTSNRPSGDTLLPQIRIRFERSLKH